MTRRFSFVITVFVALLAWSVPASADVIVDCSGMEEGDPCTTQGGTQGVCKTSTGTLRCHPDDNNMDAGMTDAGEEDVGPTEDAGMADAGTSNGGNGGEEADEGCSATGSGPARTLLPLLVGFGLLAATRRRDG